MSGSVKKDEARGTWYFVIDARSMDGRRRQVKRRGFSRKKDAEKALDELHREMTTGRGVEPTRATFGQFLEERWLPHVETDDRLAPTTRHAYRNAARHLIRLTGGVELQELRGDDLDRAYAQLRDRSTSLRRQVHLVAHKSLRDAGRWRLVGFNAAEDATPPPQPRPDPKAWTPSQVSTFLEHAGQDRWATLWRLAATTGMRRGELVGLCWSDFDADRQEVTVRRNVTVVDHALHFGPPKNGRYRTIRLDPDTVAVLRAHRRRQAEELLVLGEYRPDQDSVFTWPDGSLVHPNVISRTFKRIAQRAELPPLRLHSLRHAWATNALAAGVDVKDVATRLGHASTRITYDIYVAPSSDRDAAAASLVAGMYRAQ